MCLSPSYPAGALAYAGSVALDQPLDQEDIEAAERLKLQLAQPMPTRAQQWQHLCQGTRENPFDLFIIGGGATGTGCAVDAVTRHALALGATR